MIGEEKKNNREKGHKEGLLKRRVDAVCVAWVEKENPP